MRKLTLTLALLVTFGWVSAQQLQSTLNVNKKLTDISATKMAKMTKSTKTFVSERNAANKALTSRWYNAAFTIDNLVGDIGTSAANFIFPDSTLLVNYSTGLGAPWIHSVAEVCDPQSSWYDSSDPAVLSIKSWDNYTIDSIGFYGFYTRNTVSTTPDTLVIQIQTNEKGSRYWNSTASPWVMTNFGTDTLSFRAVNRDMLSMFYTGDTVTTIKVLLNDAVANDTLSNGINYINVAPLLPIEVRATNTFNATFTFVPGYTWTPNVDLMDDHNNFRFISMEENGDNGGPGTLPSYTRGDWTVSTILPIGILYDTTWSLVQYPSYGYDESYAYEHHWIEFLLTAEKSDISAQDIEKDMEIGQNRPNPFSGTTVIDYTLTSNSDVSVDVYNVAGAKVMSINEGSKSAGSYSMTIDGSELQSGVYYYTFTVNGNQTTKKMIVY